jgi:hypothetical protein
MVANFDELTFHNLKMTNNADVDRALGVGVAQPIRQKRLAA